MVSEAVCLVFGWETKEKRGILCTFRSRCYVPENIEAAREVRHCCAYICILQSCSNSYLLQNQTLEHFTKPGRMNRPALELLLWLRQLTAVLHFIITPVYCTLLFRSQASGAYSHSWENCGNICLRADGVGQYILPRVLCKNMYLSFDP